MRSILATFVVALLSGTAHADDWHGQYILDHCMRDPSGCVYLGEDAEPDDDDLLRFYLKQAIECGIEPFLAVNLLHVEELSGVPKRIRGLTLAKACVESRGNVRAVGDNGKAIGIFQLWPWAEQFIHDRTDPIASAHVFLGRIVTTERTVHRYCPGVRDRWRLAWIRVNRGPFWRRPDKAGEPRCSGNMPFGLKRLKRWRLLALRG